MILSLCIPTRNRAHTLPALFDSIQAQWRPGVEVIIGDNGSTDGTERIVRAFIRRMPKGSVTFLRWPTNREFNANIVRCVGAGTGDMAWLVGSDDQLDVGSLARVLDTIQNCPGALILGDVVRSNDGMGTKEPSATAWPDYSTFYLDEPGSVARYLAKARTVRASFPFLSCVVFPRPLFPKVVPAAWVGLNYHHLYAAWRMVLDGVPVVTRRKVLVRAAMGFPNRRDGETAAAVLQSVQTVFQLKRLFTDPADRAAICRVWALEYPAWRIASLQERCRHEPTWPFIKAGLQRLVRGGIDAR